MYTCTVIGYVVLLVFFLCQLNNVAATIKYKYSKYMECYYFKM